MKVFACEFRGSNRFTGQAVVVAENRDKALKIINQRLADIFPDQPDRKPKLTELDLTWEREIVQFDGDY